MAQDVSEEFKAAWRRKSWGDSRYRVSWKRRYWNGADVILEAAWTELSNARIIKRVPAMTQQLDSERQDEFLITQFALEVANEKMQWIESLNSPSMFAADTVAELGYIAKRSEVQIEFGLKLASGLFEYVPVFIGVVMKAPICRSDSAVAEVTLWSRAAYLQTEPEVIHDTLGPLEDCSPATGDGVTTVFKTTSSGIRSIDDVQVNAMSKTPGETNDYTVSDLNENKRATITFAVAPPATQTIKASGTKWKLNLSIEDIFGLVCDAAGLDAGDREIDPVIFPGLSGFKQVDTQDEWNAVGIAGWNSQLQQNVETISRPGFIRKRWHLIDDFSDLDYTADPQWYELAGGVNFSAATGELTGNSTVNFLQLNLTLPVSGTFSFRMKRTSGSTYLRLLAKSGTIGFPGTPGYQIAVRMNATRVALVKMNATAETDILLQCNTDTDDVVKVSYDLSTGKIWLAVQGQTTPDGTQSDTTDLPDLDTSNVAFYCTGQGAVDDIYFSKAALPMSLTDQGDFPVASTPRYESEWFDLVANPDSWAALEYVVELFGGTISWYTNVADEGVPGQPGAADGWVALDASDIPQSNLKRFVKVAFELTTAGTNGDITSPEVDLYRLNFTTSNVFISVVNLAGVPTLWAVLERYASPPGYEFGFRANGKLFLRRKAQVPTSVVDLTQENAIIAVGEYDPGDDRVQNVGRVRHDDLLSEYDKTSAGEAEPTSERIYGRIANSPEDLSGILFANDVNIADARARIIYENGFRRKRRWRITVWLIPWLELSDGATISYFDDPIMKATVWGDPALKWGSDFMSIGEAQNVLARSQLVKVLEWTPDLLEYAQSSALVEEVLS